MITEDYVSYEVAKLLKEKGFNGPCRTCYPNKKLSYYDYIFTNFELIEDIFSAPTLQMAMKWLREVYNIHINIQPDFPSDKDYKMFWCWSASILHENCISTKGYQCYIETYEEACEAAIKYCLENVENGYYLR